MIDDYPFVSRLAPTAPAGLVAKARARHRLPRVALVNAGSPNALQGIREAADQGLAEPILIGNPMRIAATAEAIGWDIGGLRLVAAPGETAAPEAARMAREGEADSIMKGQIHTSTFLKGLLPSAAGLRDAGTRCGHVFHITAPGSERPLLLTDAALNVRPDLVTRAACLTHAVTVARALGIARPKVGILAPSEDAVPSVPVTMEAAELATWARAALPDVVAQGPMALDLIFSKSAALAKSYQSEVTGDADIMLVPEITTGNALFKLMVLGMGCCSGGIVMGLKVPILLTSRSQGAADRLASAALGAVMAR